jgi:hypothetical protein
MSNNLFAGFIAFISVGGFAPDGHAASPTSRNAEIVDAASSKVEPARKLLLTLALDDQSRPRTIAELEAAIYRAIPENHLRFIAGYIGYGDRRHDRTRFQYAIDYQRSLYANEIVNEAWRRWRMAGRADAIRRVAACVGEDFAYHIIIGVGLRFVAVQRTENSEGNWDLVNAFQDLNNASKRLHSTCEQLVRARGS